MTDPTSRFAPGGRPRRARRSWRDDAAPPSHAVQRGYGTILPCTVCGLSVETIEIGVGPDLDAATFRCALCLVPDEVFVAPEKPEAHVGPPEALRVLQRRLGPVEVEPPLDLLALLGGPESRPDVAAAPPALLVSRPVLPEAAGDEHADAADGSHLGDLDAVLDAFRRR